MRRKKVWVSWNSTAPDIAAALYLERTKDVCDLDGAWFSFGPSAARMRKTSLRGQELKNFIRRKNHRVR